MKSHYTSFSKSFWFCILLTVGQVVQAQTFEDLQLSLYLEHPSQFEWIDLDNDNDLDLFYIHGQTMYLLRNDQNSFTGVAAFNNNNYVVHNYKFGDYDADGDVDILIVKYGILSVAINNGNFNFTMQETGISNCQYLYWVDIDGDADMDIVANNKIWINSIGVYSSSSVIPDEDYSKSWVDLNNDGLLDVISLQNDGNLNYDLWVYMNKGNEIFEKTQKISKNMFVKWFDADADGDLDLLLFGYNLTVELHRNQLNETGTLSFEKVQVIPGFYGTQATISDLNMDGLPDLVLHEDANLKSNSLVYRNETTNSTIQFVKVDTLQSPEKISDIDIVDYNNDNKPDIFFGGLRNFDYITGRLLTVFINTTNAVTTNPETPTGLVSDVQKNIHLTWVHNKNNSSIYYNVEIKKDGQPYKSSLTNAQGKLHKFDLLDLCPAKERKFYDLPEGVYEWRVQAFDHAFRTSSFSEYSAFEVKPAPKDLAVENISLTTAKLTWSYDFPDASFAVFRKDGDNGFTEITTVPGGIHTYTETVPSDQHYEYFIKAINDGIYSPASKRVDFYSTTFVKVSLAESLPNSLTGEGSAADFDLDGDYDVSFANAWLENDGHGSFAFTNPFLPTDNGSEYNSQVAVDFDNDGDPDICAVSSNLYGQKLWLYKNDNGNFIKTFETPDYAGIFQYALEDINQDGRVDLIVSRAQSNSVDGSRNNDLWLQSSEGEFQINNNNFPLYNGAFYFWDLNRDGYTDVIFSNGKIFENLRGQGFNQTTVSLPSIAAPLFGDFDRDLKVDLITGEYPLKFYRGLGDFQFQTPTTIALELGVSAFRSSDLDLDGLPDLLATAANFLELLHNEGGGNFSKSNYSFGEIWSSPPTLMDMDADGDVDILRFGSTYDAGKNEIYKNQNGNSENLNAPPQAPQALQAVPTMDNVVLTWTPSIDDKTSTEWISYNVSIKDGNGKIWVSTETTDDGSFHRRFAKGNAGYSSMFVINNLPVGVYYTQVQALDASFMLSPWSEEIIFEVIEGPKELTVERILLNKVKLQWTNSVAMDKIYVMRRKPNTTYEVIAELPGSSTLYVDDDLELENQYHYQVSGLVNNDYTKSSNKVTWNTSMLVLTETNLPVFSGSLDVGDYTSDGKMDLLVLGPEASAAYENTTGGWVKHHVGSSVMPRTSSFTFQDINGDNQLDVYEYGEIDWQVFKTEVFMNNADKTFSAITNTFTSNYYELFDWWDYDMDNDLDPLVSKESGSGPQSLIVLKNGGNGDFSDGQTLCGGCNSTNNAVFGDFDRDGDEDVMAPGDGGYVITFSGNMDKPSPVLEQNYSSTKGYPIDYNGDGWLDVYFSFVDGWSGKSTLFKNLGLDAAGNLHFDKVKDDFPTGESLSINWIDYDHDGDLDLTVLAGYSNLYRNEGGDNFRLIELPALGNVSQSRWIDIDTDGDVDLVAAGAGNQRKVFVNRLIENGTGPINEAPLPPNNFTVTQDSLGTYLLWNDGADDHTASGALTYDVILFGNGKFLTKGMMNPETGLRLKLLPGRNFNSAALRSLLPGDYTWKVQAVDQNFKGSSLSIAGPVFTFKPPQPITKTEVTVYSCNNEQMLYAFGENIEWFSDKELINKVGSGETYHPVETQFVYVTQTVNGVRGFSKRAHVTVKVRPEKPIIDGPNPLAFCEYEEGFSSSVAAEGRSGGGIYWYGDSTKTEYLNQGILQIIAKEEDYYVVQNIDGCDSEVEKLVVYKEAIESDVRYEDGQLITLEESGDYYEWFFNDEAIPNSNTPAIPLADYGAYVVGITKGHCYEFSEPYIAIATGTESGLTNEVKVFPNPVANAFTLELPAITFGEIEIIDISGKLVYERTIDSTTGQHVSINSAGWNKGLYIVNVTNGQRKFHSKIVKQ